MAYLDKEYFLKKYEINPKDFNDAGLEWKELQKIYSDYVETKVEYEDPAKFIINKLMRNKTVHSVRYRIKSPEHLIEKIIRKRINDPARIISLENYQDEITDIIGIRALYLFKKDWKEVHHYITSNWNMLEKPTLYHRSGDSEAYIEEVCASGCVAKEHKYGYRSIHYLISTQPLKYKFKAELQIRTIFEEAWSEIDHEIRYPYYMDHPIFLNQLLILNRLAGTADEMSTFLKDLQLKLTEKEKSFQKELSKKEELLETVSQKLEKLKKQTPSLDKATEILTDKEENISLRKDELKLLSDLIEKINIKRIHIDTDKDGIPDTYLLKSFDNQNLIGLDKDQDGEIDFYIKL
jgi:ppGpp synthetase/RelA/SpoT-type nucleotidyltranferase